MDRRNFVASAGTLSLIAALGIPMPVWAAPTTPREDIETFSADPAKVASLRKAFKALQDRTVDKPVGWFNYAAIHGVFPDDADALGAAKPLATYWNQCHRDHKLFFIWHRAYLLAFERNLQALAGDATLRLPYWDWYKNPKIPAAYLGDKVGGVDNPLFHAGRRPYVANGGVVWNPISSGAIDDPDFGGFQFTLDRNEHGRIHVNIGGHMGDPSTAARDPVFWAHHANVDRLLAAWLGQQHTIPDQSGTFDKAGYKFPIENAADLLPKAAILDMASTTPLGGYQSLDAPFKTPVAKPTVRPTIIRRIASRSSVNKGVLSLNLPISVDVPAGGASLAFAVPRANDTKLKNFLNSVPLAQAGEMTVVLENVTISDRLPEGLSGFDVFANLPEGSTENSRPFKIGRISIFDLKVQHWDPAMNMMMPMASELRFPATSQFRAAAASRDIVVSLVADIAPGADISKSAPTISIGNARVEVNNNPTM